MDQDSRETIHPAVPASGPLLHRQWFPGGSEAWLRPCDAPCPERARPFVLAATILGSAMAFIDGTVVHIALPAIGSSFGVGVTALQWVVSVYALMLGALILVGGALGDRLGRRRVFVLGIAIFTIASVLCALAPGVGTLVAARALQGVGAALLVPQSLAIIAASFPENVRGRYIGIWAGFAAITTAAGPIVGGAFIDLVSWRAAFWINLPLAAITVWLATTWVPESRDEQAGGRLDVTGAALAVAGLALLTWGMTSLPERGIGDWLAIAALIAGAAVLAAFLVIEQRIPYPMMPPGLFRSRDFSAANAITLFLYFSLSVVLFLLPFNLIQLQGYSALQAGMALLPFGLVMGALSGMAGKLADRFGPRPLLAAGSAMLAVSCFGMGEIGSESSYWLNVLPPVLALAFGMTLAVAPLTTAVMNGVPERAAGTASGINNAISRLAGLVAVAAGGALAAAVFGHGLESSLAEAGLNGELAVNLLAGTEGLAAVTIPDNIGADTRATVSTLVDQTAVQSLRAGMWLGGVSAVLASIAALVFLDAKNSDKS